ncbi:unnamed protein product [Allacma fusca]|uniref:Nucleolar MIF4G domain-containing protein 1 n=1 Tax=Allacma fusca TaxID=39272 RepID=A0A8J2K2W1_9HEXA|nr:unnamed protein product [Allacma fusca]
MRRSKKEDIAEKDQVVKNPKPNKQKKGGGSAKKAKRKDSNFKRKNIESEFRKEEEELKRGMEESRRKRFIEDNEEEDRHIRQLEKKLRLNKKAIIPESFRTDGLDYLLEVCTSSKDKKKTLKSGKKSMTTEYSDPGSEDSEGGELGEDEEGMNEDFNSDLDQDDSDGEMDFSGDEDEEGDEEDAEIEVGSADELENEDDLVDSDVGEESEEVTEEHGDSGKIKAKKSNSKELWEDIYGRLRNKAGDIINEKTMMPEASVVAKYVPPARRGNQSSREKITRSLKGFLNRLAETNMHSIAQQIEELYMSNSRNEMNECLLDLFYLSLMPIAAMPERIILEHCMLIAILHANVGSEIGAFFIQNFVQKFRTMYDEVDSLEETKELQNLSVLISSLYHFKIVGSGLIFDILDFMAKNFNSKDIELILMILRSVGFRLRKDDPVKLKNLVVLLQQQASEKSKDQSDSRVKFMLEVLLAIKNNNMSKIPNYDPTYGEHLLKMIKQHFHKGNYVTELFVGMQDLLDAETKGRWWIVGSAWSNDTLQAKTDNSEVNTTPVSKEQTKMNAELLAKAKRFGMNTDTRRNIFSVIMTAEDYLDAFEKLMHLGLKNQLEREIIHVIVYCCLHEKKYNPYYALILSRLCATDRRFMLTLQFSLWDRLKDLVRISNQQLENISQLLTDLIIEKSLAITILKVVEFGDLKKQSLKLLKTILTGVLLQENKENIQDIFSKIALSEKLHIFRESLRLFMGHFLLKSSISIDGENVESNLDAKSVKRLEERVKIAERAMHLGMGRLDQAVHIEFHIFPKYAQSFKLEVVSYAKELGQRSTSRLFCISQKRIHEWLKLSARTNSNHAPTNVIAGTKPDHSSKTVPEASTTGTNVKKRSSNFLVDADTPLKKISPQSAKQIVDLNVEKEVHEWVQSLDVYPSSTEIRTKALELYREKGHDKIKCSYGWYRRWSERFKEGISSHETSDPIVLAWLLEQYDNNVLVTYSSLQSFAQRTLVTIKPDFKASPGWATRFFKRHHIFLNWDGYNEKKLPEELHRKVEEFWSRTSQISWKDFQTQQIGCMDEIPLSFTASKVKDNIESGVKASRLKKVSVKNGDATVILALRADGQILPPMVVVKAQKSSSLNQVYSINDNPVVVYYSKTTEPSVNALEKWMDLIWLKNVKVPNVLFWDSYDLHQTIARKMQNNDVKNIIFPPGCSCKLQPINAYAKLTFQKLIDTYWEDYLKKNNRDLKLKLPSTNEMVEWISQAYETMRMDVHKTKLKDSFKKVKLLPDGLGG